MNRSIVEDFPHDVSFVVQWIYWTDFVSSRPRLGTLNRSSQTSVDLRFVWITLFLGDSANNRKTFTF